MLKGRGVLLQEFAPKPLNAIIGDLFLEDDFGAAKENFSFGVPGKLPAPVFDPHDIVITDEVIQERRRITEDDRPFFHVGFNPGFYQGILIGVAHANLKMAKLLLIRIT